VIATDTHFDQAGQAALITVEHVAKMLSYSTRQVYRMADVGTIPRPIKIGKGTRWRKSDIDEWIALGCPKVDSFQN